MFQDKKVDKVNANKSTDDETAASTEPSTESVGKKKKV